MFRLGSDKQDNLANRLLGVWLGLNKNTLFSPSEARPLAPAGLWDGLKEDIPVLRDLTTALQEPLLVSDDLLVTHTIEPAYTLELEFQEPTQK